MIKEIDRERLKSINNQAFKEYAQIYIDREEMTLNSIETIGLPFEEEKSLAEKHETISKLKNLGALVRNNKKSIVSNQKISPACIACQTGTGSYTTYTSLKCHRNCYFCFNPNQEDYMVYKDKKKDIIKELQEILDLKVDLQHLALTGGEPLLHKEEMLEFFTYAREKTPDTYTRLYTTGDLFDEETLKGLQEVELDEVRFSIKMDDSKNKIRHTLRQIKLAKEYIPNILVEMPVIPGTLKDMKQLLIDLDEIGIFGINLLEFCFPLGNIAEFSKRNFHLKNPPYEVFYNYWYAGGLAVAESEDACFELVEFAIENNLKLGVHYCSLENKYTGQVYQQNHKAKVDSTYTFSNKDYFFKTAKAFGRDRRLVSKALKSRGITVSENDDYDFIQFPLSAIKYLQGKDLDIALSMNVVEEDQAGLAIREVGLSWTKPDLIDLTKDI